MRKHKKKIVFIILFCFIVLWGCRYVVLNDGFQIKHQLEHQYYELGEIAPMEDNMCLGKQYYKDLAISVDAFEIVDADEYISRLGKTEEDFSLLVPDKIAEATITIYNNDTEQQGVYFSSLQLVGTDWYEYFNREFTAYANDIFEDNVETSYGIIILPKDNYTVKVVFNMFQRGCPDARWQNIEKEDIYIQTTIRPVSKYIKVQ